MNARRDSDLLIKAFLEDGVNELPDRSYDAVRAATEETRQWVVIGPWREQQMSRFAMFAVAAAVIVLAAVVGLRFLPSDSGPGVGGQPTPTAIPTTAPTPSPRPTAAPTPTVSVLPSLTEQYTSSMHGITVSYPAGWMLQPATEPWVSGWLTQESTSADVILSTWDGDLSAFIALASQPLSGKTDQQWIDDFRALGSGENCGPVQPHTVDGVEGGITDCDDGPHALVVTEGRAFVVWLYSIEDQPYFEQILATVQLDPAAVPPLSGPIVDPALGPLNAGTYVAHPFAPPNDDMAFTLTVSSDSWAAVDWLSEDGGMSGVAWAGDSGGVAAGFVRVDTLNQDPCNWSGSDDDVAVGPSVDDLISALARTKEGIEGASNRYTVSEPAKDVSLGGYSGKQVVVTMPADPALTCDEGYVIWNAEGFDPDAMGSENRWTVSILDVEGERVVILVSDFEDSDPERVQELQSIVASIEITVE